MRISVLIAASLLLCLTASSQGKKQTNDTIDFISVEHIGISDKPIKFIISYQRLAEDSIMFYNRMLKVDRDIFDINYALLEKESTHIKKVERRNFGVFQIMMRERGNVTSYLLPNREFSIDYFRKLKYVLDKEVRAGEIVYEVEKVLSRIR